MKKRMLALLLGSALVVSTLAGCGSNGEETSKSAEESSQVSSQTESKEDSKADVKEDPIVISWLAYDPTATPDEDAPVIKAVEEKYNVKFEIWTADTLNWDESINARLASGEVPDVLRLKKVSNLAGYVKQGLLGEVPISLIEEKAPSYMAMVNADENPDSFFAYTTYKGINYGFASKNTFLSYPFMIVWRLDWLKNVGIDKVPETLEEFEEAMYKFTFEDPDQNGVDDTYGMSSWAMPAVMGAFGNSRNEYEIGENEDGELEFLCMNEGARKGLETLQKWYADGVIDPEWVTGEQADYWAQSDPFTNDRIGVTSRSRYDHWLPANPDVEGSVDGRVLTAFMELHKDQGEGIGDLLAMGDAPIGPDGYQGLLYNSSVSEPILFSAECAQDEAKMNVLLQMLEDLYSDYDYYKLVQWGIEGEDYNVDEATGLLKLTTSDIPTQRTRGISVLNFLSIPPEFDLKANGTYANDKALEWSTPGYDTVIIPSTDVEVELKPALKQLTSEYFTKIITGEYSIDKFDEYLKLMKEAGSDKVLEAINEAIDEAKGR